MPPRNRRIEQIPAEDVVRLYRDELLSADAIGRRLGWSAASIINRLIQLGIVRRSAWARRAVDCDIDDVRRLYVVEHLSLIAVAARLGCSEGTIRRRLQALGVARREDGSEPKHIRTDFSGELTEKAYLIGFRIGDLNVELKGGRTILVKCTSTRAEQVQLFRQLFEPYGHVYTDEATLARRERQSIGMQVGLNLTFDFLLPKQDAVPGWILASDEPFFAFLAGYIDAEGYFRTYFHTGQPKPLARLEIRSYDATLLRQLGEALNARRIACPPAQLCVAAGYTNSYDVTSNRDLWRLGVQRRDSLRNLVTRLEPYVQHARRRRDMLNVLRIC
jgi:AraC-like DNA-binding protein